MYIKKKGSKLPPWGIPEIASILLNINLLIIKIWDLFDKKEENQDNRGTLTPYFIWSYFIFYIYIYIFSRYWTEAGISLFFLDFFK